MIILLVMRVLGFRNVVVQNVILLSWMDAEGVIMLQVRVRILVREMTLFHQRVIPLLLNQITKIQNPRKMFRCLKTNLMIMLV